MASGMELKAGTVVDGRYTVQSLLGEGGMAVVYKVSHHQLGTSYALKLLTIPAKSVRVRLLREGRVQAAIRHPNIVSVTDVVVIDGAPGLVMELIEGPTLEQLLVRKRLTLDQVDAIASGVISGVAEAHARGLIHRDLKPANILLAVTASGLVPKVADFGLAKILAGDNEGADKTRSGIAMGTPHYMAPEQIRDAKNVDERADIFSLGVILYQLVTGERPFTGEDTFEIFRSVTDGKYRPLRELVPEIPPRMVWAIEGALQSDPEIRVSTTARLLGIWKGEIEYFDDDDDTSSGPWDEQTMDDMRAYSSGDPISALSDSGLAVSSGAGRVVSSSVEDTRMRAAELPIAPVGRTIELEHPPHVPGPVPIQPGDASLLPIDATTVEEPTSSHRNFRAASLLLGLLFSMTALVAVVIGAASLGALGMVVLTGDVETETPDVSPVIEPADPDPDVVEVAPEPETPAPEEPPPVEALPVEAPPTPEPALVIAAPVAATPPEPAVRSDRATVVIEGVDRAWLVSEHGRFRAGEVAPGTYTVQVFFEPTTASEVATITVAAGETRTLRCVPELLVCR